jgi:fructokinase
MTAGEFPGPECYCGKRGCIEMFLSGPGFARDYEAATGESLSSRDIVAKAQAGDARAAANVDRYVDRLARGLASVINLLDPDIIVLGGGMSNLPQLAGAVSAELPRYVFSDSVQTRVVRNQHGDSSGVRGAAWLWPLTQSIP